MHQDGFNSIQIMISKIISRAACLTELISNPKSFSNCPDLHGGVPGLPGDRIYMKPALGKKKVAPQAVAGGMGSRLNSESIRPPLARASKLWAG
jgi:hypothetical protein